MVADPEIDTLFPKVKRAIVTVTTKDGGSFTKQEDFAKGRAERPLTDEELIGKFRANASGAVTDNRLDKIARGTLNLEGVSDIRNYMKLLIR